MMLLLEVCGKHTSAVIRDLIVADYHLVDIPGKMSWPEFMDFVFAAPPGTATRHAIDGGWSRTDQLLATLIEALTGNAVVDSRFDRPGVSKEETQQQRDSRRAQDRQHKAPKKDGTQFGRKGDSMTPDEFDRRYAEQQAVWAAEAAAKSHPAGGAGGEGVSNP